MTIDPRIQAYLDGELHREDLPVELATEAACWDALLRDAREGAPAHAPAELRPAVMHAVRQAPRDASVAATRAAAQDAARQESSRARSRRDARGLGHWIGWLVRPMPMRVPPLATAVAAAVLALALTLPWGTGFLPELGLGPVGPRADAGADEAGPQVYVEFNVQAPTAQSVAVAGDFNAWQPAHRLQDVDEDGTWSGRIPLEPGVHEYMFVLDGTRWVTDPEAARYADDGFGHRNAVVAIAPPRDGT